MESANDFKASKGKGVIRDGYTGGTKPYGPRIVVFNGCTMASAEDSRAAVASAGASIFESCCLNLKSTFKKPILLYTATDPDFHDTFTTEVGGRPARNF